MQNWWWSYGDVVVVVLVVVVAVGVGSWGGVVAERGPCGLHVAW